MFSDLETLNIVKKHKEKAFKILIEKYPEYNNYEKYLRYSSIFPNEIIQISIAMELTILSGENFVTIWSHKVSRDDFRKLTLEDLQVITLIFKEKDIPHSIMVVRYIEKEKLYEYKDPDWKKYEHDKNGQPKSVYIGEDLLVKKNYGNPLTIYTSYIPKKFKAIEYLINQLEHYRIEIL
ncbi:MAG: hypothetical protein O9275_05150 [Microcystis sp. LE19-196.1B]|nr:hypothetical protein [Microcystis sp. LE19-196.1B]